MSYNTHRRYADPSTPNTMELQAWSSELTTGRDSVGRKQKSGQWVTLYKHFLLLTECQNTGYAVALGPAQIKTQGTGQFQSVDGAVGLAAGVHNSRHFAAIVGDEKGFKVQVKGNATVMIDRHNNIRAQVDNDNYAEYNRKPCIIPDQRETLIWHSKCGKAIIVLEV